MGGSRVKKAREDLVRGINTAVVAGAASVDSFLVTPAARNLRGTLMFDLTR